MNMRNMMSLRKVLRLIFVKKWLTIYGISDNLKTVELQCFKA